MNKKARFISVENIRSFETVEDGQKVTKWAVKYTIEFEYPRRDGSMGRQQILADAYYPQRPDLQVGPVDDPNIYEMQFFFKVRKGTGRNGEAYAFQDIILSKASQSVI